MPPTDTQRLVLVGMMGSGKTTVGRLLAEATGWPYIDNDEVLREMLGRTAGALADEAEETLREAEADALLAALSRPGPSIVGAAAGTILDSKLRREMADAGTVVWLRAQPETLARRVEGSKHRPWLEGDPLAWLQRASAKRAPLYASIADFVVDVDDQTPAEVAAAISARGAPL